MPGMDASAGDRNARLYPPDYDPLDAIRVVGEKTNDLLTRIASALENQSLARDIIVPLVPSVGPGNAGITVSQLGHPRIRGKFVVFLPVGTGEPTIRYGSADILHSSIQAVPAVQVIPFPFVWQEGQDIYLYDAVAPTVVPAYTAIIIGTSE